jgi:hypothetical protein
VPELDIVTYFPRASKFSTVDAISHAVFEKSAQAPRDQQIHLATYVMKPQGFIRRGFELEQDRDTARILRSVLMKPEQENWIPDLHSHVETLTKQLIKEHS